MEDFARPHVAQRRPGRSTTRYKPSVQAELEENAYLFDRQLSCTAHEQAKSGHLYWSLPEWNSYLSSVTSHYRAHNSIERSLP